ncbi:MAG: MFS transporter [Chloroflexota bacterium]
MLQKLRSSIGVREPWQRTLWVMFFAQVCTAVGFSIIFPFLPLYVEDLGTRTSLSIEFWAGMVFSAQAVTMMIASPIWGAIADRFGRKLMVQRATFGGMIIIGLMAFANTAEELVLLRAIQGVVTGVVAASNALVAAAAPRDRTGFAMGTLQVALWSGVSLGPLLGGVMADAFGYRVPFLITAMMLFIAGLLVHFFVYEDFTPEAKAANRDKGFVGEWRHILGMPGVLQTYLVRFMTGLTRSMLIPIMPLYIAMLISEQSFTFTPEPFAALAITILGVSTITGLVVGSQSAAATFSAVYLGRLGDQIGHRRIVLGSAVFAAVFMLPQALVSAPWQLLLLTLGTGLATGGLVAAPSALLARYTEPGEEGAVYGLDNSVLAASRAIAPLLGAFFAASFGLRSAYVASAVLLVAVLIVALVMLPRDPIAARTTASADEAPAEDMTPTAQPASAD